MIQRPTALAAGTAFVLVLVPSLAGCADDAPDCGTGVFDPRARICTCPEVGSPGAEVCVLPRDGFDLQAHRGASATVPPGNTLPAFLEAIRVGADTLEGDMRITADGHVVLHHDAALMSQCTWVGVVAPPATRVVHELSAEAIASFDCHPERPGIDAPPPLADVLDLAKLANVGFDLELKDTALADVDVAMSALRDYDAACGGCLAGRLVVQSFGADALRHARDTYHTSAFSFAVSALAIGGGEPAEIATFADIYSPVFGFVTRQLVEAFHAEGVRVVPWTVNDPQAMCALVEAGVDGLITDDPALAAATLRGCR